MLIKNITIENFQSYYDSQTLEFSKGLNLVVGKGGKGKSKLFNAFYWVLFGKIYITDIGWCTTDTLPNSAKFTMQKHEFVNQKALFDCEVGGKINTVVALELEDDKGNSYAIERSVQTKRLNAESIDSPNTWEVSNNTLKVSFDTNNGTVLRTGDMADNIISNLFPEDIRNYIWFQGESLESLIDFRNKEKLKAAVKHISYYPYYEKLSEIISKSKSLIDKMESKKLKEVNKYNSDVKSLVSTKELKQKQIELEEEKRQKAEDHIKTISIALADSETKMSGLAGFTSLVKKYDDCKNEIDKLSEQINEIDKFQRNQLPNFWILRSIEPMVRECKNIIENHKNEEYTMPERKYLDIPGRRKLEEILKDGQCFVCGSKVSEDNGAVHYIKERIRMEEEFYKEQEDFKNNMLFSKKFNMFVGKIQDYPDSLLMSLSRIDKQYDDSEDKIENLMSARKKQNDYKKSLDEEIQNVKVKYGVNPVEQADTANMLKSSIVASRSNLERERRKLEDSKKLIATYNREIKEAQNKLDSLYSKDKSIEKVPETEWKNISTFLEDICKTVQENARKELLRKIEERSNQFYTKFTEHDNGYKGNVKIGEDYSIEFDPGLNTSHEDRKKMSIINALLALNQEAVGTYYPFISDAPTSSFDTETTHKYLLGIKDIFGQSIIMTKDVDVDSEHYNDLFNQPNVSKIYLLESALYCNEGVEPQLYEVSTKVSPKK